MVICEPNKFVAEVHDRMPVLLTEKDFEPWLSTAAGLELLKACPRGHDTAVAGIEACEQLKGAG
jgi:putative SOS response-associated peptidase YedK